MCCKVIVVKRNIQLKKTDVIYVESLNEEERQLSQIRVKADCNSDALLDTVCTYHKHFYIDSYSKHHMQQYFWKSQKIDSKLKSLCN